MDMQSPGVRRPDRRELRQVNLRLARILGSIAAAFFIGAIVARYMGGLEMGMSILGFAALVLLIVVLSRNIRDR